MDFLEEELEEILNIFREESEEQIQKLNQNLLKLEANPGDGAAISELFREAHSIKGAARMIGLTDIQTLAHKLEDIFGHAREGRLHITPAIVDKMCKTVDFISSIVEESIKTKGIFHSDKVDELVADLKKIEDEMGNEAAPVSTETLQEAESQLKNTEAEEDMTFFQHNESKLPEIKDYIEQLKEFSTDTEPVLKLQAIVAELDESSSKVIDFKTKEALSDIRLKLDGVIRGSGILIQAEIDEIKETFTFFCNRFNEILNGPTDSQLPFPNKIEPATSFENEVFVESTGAAFEFEEPAVAFTPQPKSEENSLDELLDFVQTNVMCLSESGTSNTINKLVTSLAVITATSHHAETKNIFQEIYDIAVFVKDSSSKPGSEILEVVKESFNTARIMMSVSPDNMSEDPHLILQRLKILHQMLKISEQEPSSSQEQTPTTEKPKTENNLSTSPNYPVAQDLETVLNSAADGGKGLSGAPIKTLRVDTKKLDQLVSQVGELIIAKIKAKDHLVEIEKMINSFEEWYRELNKIKQFAKYMDKRPARSSELPVGTSIYFPNKNINNFFDDSSSRLADFMNQMNTLYRTIQEDDARLNLIVNELEERIKNIRVLPLATIFHMFPRMVRDIAREKNKNIDLVITGSETSVDKKIIEEIKSPLIHIIRNAIDHGLEEPHERLAHGKNPVGRIHLSAHHLENSVLIEIEDDGRGINVEAIKRKVLQKNLLTSAELQTMTEEQIINIIFWPGFSTGEVVTDISGRGIGLDIVHTKITQLNGKVSIKSVPGHGCKVSIILPVTMATIKSFLVQVNEQTFAIPTSSIKTALLINSEEIFYKEGRETIIVNNTTVPVCKLSKILERPDDKPVEGKVVIIVIKSEDGQIGFIIDRLLGDQEILHKNLNAPLLRVRNVAGVTTLGSGELCLILNVHDLIKSAYSSFGMSQKQFTIKKGKSINRETLNILVVDDSVTTRILERNILKAAGYNVTIATNGLDALTKLASEKFNLIVSDIEMPEINGFELTERVKTSEEYKHIPIILVSSLASELDKKKGLGLGASAYIQKGGFDQEELLSTISKLIE